MDDGPDSTVRAVAELASDVTFSGSVAGRIEWISSSVADVVGRSTWLLVGQPFVDIVHPDDADAVRAALAAIADGVPARLEVRVDASSGWRWMSIAAKPAIGPDGTVVGWAGGWRDVDTERRERDAREEIHRRYRLLAEATADIVCSCRPDGVVDWVSPSVLPVLGLDPADVIGTRPAWIHEDDRAGFAEMVRAAIESGSFRTAMRCRLAPADGRVLWADVEVQIERDDGGGVAAMSSVMHDVTDLVQREAIAAMREEELRQMHVRRQSVFDSLTDPTVVVEAMRGAGGVIVDFRYVMASVSAIQFFGIPFDDLSLSSLLLSFRDQRTSGLFDAFVQAVETKQAVEWTARPLPHTRSGTVRLYDVAMSPAGDDLAVTWRDVTDQVQLRRDLGGALAFSRAILDASPVGIVVHRADGTVQDANAAAGEVLGLTHRQVVGWDPPPPGRQVLRDDGTERPEDEDPIALARLRCEPVRDVVNAIRHPDGTVTWLSVNAEPFGADAAPGDCGVVATYTDVTEFHRTIDAANALAFDATALADTGPDVVLKIRLDGTIAWASQAVTDLLGISPADLVGRRNMDLVHPADRPGFEIAVADALRTHRPTFLTLRVLRADGTAVWVNSTAADAAVPAGTEPYRVVRLRNVDDEVRETQTLARWATVDELTGADTRAAGLSRLGEMLQGARASATPVAVLFADVDGFKQINDRHGHAAGDEVLRLLVSRARSRLRRSDLIIRFGGDEFLIALPGISDVGYAIERARHIHAAATEPVEVAGVVLFPRLSIGVTVTSPHRDSLADAIERSDTAMNRAKHAGGHRVRADAEPDAGPPTG